MFLRVSEPGKPAFQLRKGEEGLSVFDTEGVEPSLTADEILAAFRPGSQAVSRSREEIEAVELIIVPMAGSTSLPPRLRDAHVEIRRRPTMTRNEFKNALQELE